MLLPKVGGIEEYRLVYRDAGVWLPAMQEICRRHGLDASRLVFAPPGTHVVFQVQGNRYIKLFSPLWGADWRSEQAVLCTLSARPDLPVPRLVAKGDVEGWPYLVITAVEGVPLEQVWDQMADCDRARVVRCCGAFLASLHETPTGGLDEIAVDWPSFVQGQLGACVQRVQQANLGERWVRSVADFVAALPPLYEPGFQPVLLSADVTDEHILVSERGGRWEFTGYIDFGDAMLGHPLYEFAAPGCSITRGAPRLQRAMLLAYGFSEADLNATLADRLMAYTLAHRYIKIPDLIAMFPAQPPSDLTALQNALWSFVAC